VFGSACIFGTATVSGHCAKFLMFDRCCVCVLIYWMAILSYNELHLEKHESSVNAVEDENSDSLITESISDFMLFEVIDISSIYCTVVQPNVS